MMQSLESCPLCGTKGRGWRDEKGVFECPHCSSVFSKFGIVVEAKKDMQENWN